MATIVARDADADPTPLYGRPAKLVDSLANPGIMVGYTSKETTAGVESKVLKLKASFDNGVTWDSKIDAAGSKDFGIVQSLPTSTDDNDDMMCMQDGTIGTILCVFRNHSFVDGKYSVFRITIHRSTNWGETFTFYATVHTWPASADPDKSNGLFQPQIIKAPNGNLQVYWSEQTTETDNNIVVHQSTTGGGQNSWKYLMTVVGQEASDVKDSFPAVGTISGNSMV